MPSLGCIHGVVRRREVRPQLFRLNNCSHINWVESMNNVGVNVSQLVFDAQPCYLSVHPSRARRAHVEFGSLPFYERGFPLLCDMKGSDCSILMIKEESVSDEGSEHSFPISLFAVSARFKPGPSPVAIDVARWQIVWHFSNGIDGHDSGKAAMFE